MGRHGALLKIVGVLAIASVAICLVPGGAHLFELPNKMKLPPAEYMVVQRIYTGWAFFGIAIACALVLTLTHALMVRRYPLSFVLSLVAFLCLTAMLAIFWTFTYPMNVASANWTVMPDAFEAARRQWEYSHAVNAMITFAALIAIASAVTVARPPARDVSIRPELDRPRSPHY